MLLLALVLFRQAYAISGFSALSSPGALPLAATAVMVLAAATSLVRVLARTSAVTDTGHGLVPRVRDVLPPIFGLFLGLVLLYGVALQPIGFLITSFVFLAAAFLLLDRTRRRLRPIGLAALSVIVIYVLFRLLFQVVLPEGIVPERRILADIERAIVRVIRP